MTQDQNPNTKAPEHPKQGTPTDAPKKQFATQRAPQKNIAQWHAKKIDQNASAPKPQLGNNPPNTKPSNATELLEKLKKRDDQVIRLAAEMENLKKRTQKQIEDAHKYSLTDFAKDLMEVLENLHRAQASVDLASITENESIKSFVEGVEMTSKMMTEAFKKHGLVRLSPEVGSPFDHNFHQAISSIESDSIESNSIVEVVQSGYLIHDRLLRPALVVASS